MIELLLYRAAGQSPLATALLWVLFAIVIIGLVLLVIWQEKAGEKLKFELGQLSKVKKNNVQNEFVLKALHIASWHMIVATQQIIYDYDFRERNNDWVADSNDFDDKESGLALLHEQGVPYSDMTILPNGDIGILYEGAGYATINFTTVPLADIKAQLK